MRTRFIIRVFKSVINGVTVFSSLGAVGASLIPSTINKMYARGISCALMHLYKFYEYVGNDLSESVRSFLSPSESSVL
jgi:hypothetical protein